MSTHNKWRAADQLARFEIIQARIVVVVFVV